MKVFGNRSANLSIVLLSESLQHPTTESLGESFCIMNNHPGHSQCWLDFWQVVQLLQLEFGSTAAAAAQQLLVLHGPIVE